MSNFLSGMDNYLHRFNLIKKGSNYYTYNPTVKTLTLVTETGLSTKEIFEKYATHYTLIDFSQQVFDSYVPFDVVFYYDKQHKELTTYTMRDRPKVYDPSVNGYKGVTELYVKFKDIPKNAKELYLTLDVQNPYVGDQPIEMILLASSTPTNGLTAKVNTWLNISTFNASLKPDEYIQLHCWIGQNQVLKQVTYNWK